jgi:serine/threonine protein phosphatase PrpC
MYVRMESAPKCPSCGALAPLVSARFCEECGTPLRLDSLVAPNAPPPPSAGCKCRDSEYDEEGFCSVCGRRRPAPQEPLRAHAPDRLTVVDADLAVASDKGVVHPTNEDYGLVARRPDGAALLVVTDGVSSAMDSARAARIAAEAAVAEFQKMASCSPLAIGERASACAFAAALAVEALGKQVGADEGPATTLVLAIVDGEKAAFAWVGDSRAYLIAPGAVAERVTTDDSWVEEEVAAARLTREEAMRSPDAHAITQWLGEPSEALRIHVVERSMIGVSAVLLCSDGLWNYADDSARMGVLYALASADGDAAAACGRLVDVAYSAGGHDNITVAILKMSAEVEAGSQP